MCDSQKAVNTRAERSPARCVRTATVTPELGRSLILIHAASARCRNRAAIQRAMASPAHVLARLADRALVAICIHGGCLNRVVEHDRLGDQKFEQTNQRLVHYPNRYPNGTIPPGSKQSSLRVRNGGFTCTRPLPQRNNDPSR